LLFLIAAVLLLTQENLQGRVSTGRPPSQDERELIVDRQSSQLVPGAATSPIVASSPDGRGAVYSRRSLSVSKRAACYDRGSPVASTSIADGSFLTALSYLPISI